MENIKRRKMDDPDNNFRGHLAELMTELQTNSKLVSQMDAHADANRDMQKAIYDMLCEHRDESGGEQQTGGLGEKIEKVQAAWQKGFNDQKGKVDNIDANMNVVLRHVDQISKETVGLKKQLADGHTDRGRHVDRIDNCAVQKEIQQVHKECTNWKNDSIKEYTKGMKYVEQAFKNLENKIPRKLEELLDSKLKNYVNNILQTTLESLMNKQAQELTKFLDERLTGQSGISTSQPSTTVKQSAPFEVAEQVRRSANDTTIKLKEIDASVKLMDKKFTEKLSDIEAQMKNHENAMHTLHSRTQDTIDQNGIECIQTQVKRLEAQQANLVEMNLSEALNSKEIRDKLSDMNLVITENIEQSKEQIKRLDPETQLSEVRSMNKTVISNAERNKNLISEKLETMQTTLKSFQAYAEDQFTLVEKQAEKRAADIQITTTKSILSGTSSNATEGTESSLAAVDIINENKKHILQCCNSVLKKVNASNQVLVDTVKQEVLGKQVKNEEDLSAKQLAKETKEHMNECCDTLIKSVQKKIDENVSGTVETLASLSEIIKTHCKKNDQTNGNLLLVGQDVKSIGEKCQHIHEETTRLKIESTGQHNPILTPVQPVANQTPAVPASSDFSNEVQMLHNKIDKNHAELTHSHVELRKNQHDLMKMATGNGQLVVKDTMQTLKLAKDIGEVSNSLTVLTEPPSTASTDSSGIDSPEKLSRSSLKIQIDNNPATQEDRHVHSPIESTISLRLPPAVQPQWGDSRGGSRGRPRGRPRGSSRGHGSTLPTRHRSGDSQRGVGYRSTRSTRGGYNPYNR